MDAQGPRRMEFRPAGPLRGRVRVPGDKSISHRVLMLAAMARGRSTIRGLSDGGDVRATADALRAMGVRIETDGGNCHVDGVGTGGLLRPETIVDLRNSGTSARLLMGLVATHPITAAFAGDASLSGRPMRRVIEPLSRLGADISAAPAGRLPLSIRGLCPAAPLTHRLTLPSAQVKSALLLAALNVPGVTTVVEAIATRDHSERMLARFGADIEVDGPEIRLRGEAELKPIDLRIAGDPSAAAFLIVAALIVPGSELVVESVGINPLRTGLLDLLREMGADLSLSNLREEGGEPVADVTSRHSPLTAIDVPPDRAPRMIDEFPIFFVAAAFASGTTRTRGLAELRVKETDRLAAMAAGLSALGLGIREETDGLVVEGKSGEPIPGGATVVSRLDHRVAMSFAVAGLHARAAVTVDDMTPADTSFPGFTALLDSLTGQG